MYGISALLIILLTGLTPLCDSFTLQFIPSLRQSHHQWSPSSSAVFDKTDDEIPTMDWLTNSIVNPENDNLNGFQVQDGVKDMADDPPFVEEFDADAGTLGEAPLPSTGVSVADEMQRAQADYFFTELVPVVKGLDDERIKLAQLVTTATKGSFEPVRYLVGLSLSSSITPAQQKQQKGSSSSTQEDTSLATEDFVMVDIPPFSEQLKKDMDQYLRDNNGRLKGILVTCRDNIHYNEAPGVFSIRRADLDQWTKAYPGIAVVAYRLDIPRDCRELITQRLDGYGPFALEEETVHESDGTRTTNFTFIETGRPLTYDEWDADVAEDILSGMQMPPDDIEPTEQIATENNEIEMDPYSLPAIRQREEGKRILAVYTPGRTYGSVSYIFPEIQLCASGFTIPVEDSRNEENYGLAGTGPALDCRGYITTSRAGISRQMESARNLIMNYIDRVNVLLPSRGDPVFLDGSTRQRQKWLLDVVDQYEKIGKIYEQLGIVDWDGEDNLDI